jgi:hypothetical protein
MWFFSGFTCRVSLFYQAPGWFARFNVRRRGRGLGGAVFPSCPTIKKMESGGNDFTLEWPCPDLLKWPFPGWARCGKLAGKALSSHLQFVLKGTADEIM